MVGRARELDRDAAVAGEARPREVDVAAAGGARPIGRDGRLVVELAEQVRRRRAARHDGRALEGLAVVDGVDRAPAEFTNVATHTSPKVFGVPAGSSELSAPMNARPSLSHAITGSPADAVRTCASAAFGEVSPG